MKPHGTCARSSFHAQPETITLASIPNVWGLLASAFSGLALLLNGCATHPAAISSSPSALAQIDSLTVKLGTMALARDSKPATFSFQKAKGKLGSAKEGISDATELAVGAPAAAVIVAGGVFGNLPGSDVEGGAVVAGVVGGLAGAAAAVAAPVVATQGLIQSWKTISPGELAEREAALAKAMSEMAAQERFHACLLKAAAEKSPGRLVQMDLNPPAGKTAAAPAAMLEARVVDLRLERSGSDEGSYFLRIKISVRLVRAADGAVLYDQPAEYRSGRSLFLDWTLNGALQSVADTGYRALAQHIVDRLLVGSSVKGS